MEQYPKLHLNSHHHNQQMGHPKRMLPGLVVHSTLWRRRRSQASAHRKWLPSSAHVRIVIELFFSLFYQATITWSRFPTWLHLHFTHWQENAFSGTIDQAEPQLMRTNPQSEFLLIVTPWIEEVQSVARTGNRMDHDQCIGETSRKLYVLIYFW